MRAFPPSLSLLCLAIATLSAAPTTAYAATATANNIAMGSGCQLSIPTTDTGVRPKATGFRNESATTSNFVICPMPLANSSGSGITSLYIGLNSLDGVSRNVTCTAVSNWFGNPQVYSSKSVAVSATTTYQLLGWDAADFGGTSGSAFLAFSITCGLPPQTSIDVLQSSYNYNIGT